VPSLGHLGGDLLVFDKDGVLLDFARRWSTVTRARALALVNVAPDVFSLEAAEQLLGVQASGQVLPGGLLAAGSRLESQTAAATLLLQAGWAWPRAREAATAAFAIADKLVDFGETSRSLPGVPEAIARLHGLGWKCAIATTDQTVDAWKFLHLAQLKPYFCSVVGVDKVSVGKPEPEMFLLACREARCEPARAFIVGDLDVDLLMGRTAGAAGTIGVLSGVGDAAMLTPLADFLLADVAALATLASTRLA
jgi:phosphoglycolate phosphatase